MTGKSLLGRAVVFESSRWGKFEWRYAGKKERKAWSSDGMTDVNNLLVLEKVGNKGGEERIRVAQLVRSEAVRTTGSRASSAGNGGRLEMCLSGEMGELVDEVTVVVTCLVMLKKEIDRLRACQIAMLSIVVTAGAH
jgi:hypothetical protein